MTRQTSVASEVSESETNSRPTSSNVNAQAGSRKGSWMNVAQKSVDQPSISPASSQVSADSSKPKQTVAGLLRKVSPGKSGQASAASGKVSAAKSIVSPATSKKRGGGGGVFASKMSKMRDMSFGPSGSVGINVKSLQSASMILGRFIKAKTVKKSEDEVLAGFGAEKENSSDDDNIKNTLERQASVPKEEPTTRKKGLLGKIGRAASVAKSRLKSGASFDTPADGPDGGGVSLTMLSKMATFQKQTRILIAAAYVGGQIAPWDQLTKTWLTGIPTSIRFLGRSCRVR